MDEVRASDSIQLVGTIWSFLVAYSLWAIAVAVFVIVVSVLYYKGRKTKRN